MDDRRVADTTVIVPTFNRERYIGYALDSILAQTVRPRQVMVVDDGSTDGTAAVVRGYAGRVELLSKPNGGKSSALNLALGHATGASIWIFDDDDIAAPDALERMDDALQAHPECGFAYGAYTLFRGDGEATDQYGSAEEMNGQHHRAVFGLHVGLMLRCFIMQPAMLVRRRCYDAVGPFNEALNRSQDYEMLLRLARRFPAQRVDGVMFHQRQHAGVRGTLSDPVHAGRVTQAWSRFDRLIFSAVHRGYALAEFLPHPPERDLTDDEAITAKLTRCCIMGRRHLWEEATADMREAAALANDTGRRSLTDHERSTLQHLFDAWNYDPCSVLGAPEFSRAIDRFSNRGMCRDVRLMILKPLPLHLRQALRARAWSRARTLLRAYASLATPATAAINLSGKLRNQIRRRA